MGAEAVAFCSDPVYPLKTRPPVEIAVEAQNRSYALAFHDCNVHGVARGQQRPVLGDLPGTQNVRFLDAKYFIDDVQRDLERWPNGFTFFDGRVPMENLLQHFRIGDQALPSCDQALEDDLRVGLV